jgi:protein-tyrosine phosphatase
VRNLRDAGGHLTATAESIRRGVLWRGDAPFGIDPAWSRRVESLRLHTIVDLRSDGERELRPYDTTALASQSIAIPLVGERRPDHITLRDGFGEFNRWVLDARGEQIASVLSALSRPGALPALVHCTAGKDRTGIVVALIHAWLGVPDAIIARDYALSAQLLRVDTDEAIEQQRLALGVDARLRPELLDAKPEWILGALAWLRETHATPERYLIAHGVRAPDLERLRSRLLVRSRVAL